MEPERFARSLGIAARVAALALVASNAAAQPAPQGGSAPDPAGAVQEPAAVAARLPEPAVGFQTPGFAAGRSGFASHAEVVSFVQGLRARTSMLEIRTIGESQGGRIIPMLAFGRPSDDRPTVLIIAMQRGDSPAAGEAALLLAQRLAGGPLVELLRTVSVLIVPRANPDGAERQLRATANGIELDRDHLLLRTPEARALADVFARHRPQVVIDLNEFDPGSDWSARFGGWVRYDAMLRTPTIGNLPQALDRATQQWLVKPVRAALDGEGLSSQWHHEPIAGGSGPRVSSGSVRADTTINVAGLRNSIALQVDSRGVGLGRAHLLRRVHTHATAAETVLRTVAEHGDALRRLADEQRRAVSASACTGDIVIESAPVPQRRSLALLDAATGVDRSVDVEWLSAQAAKPVRTRGRPCGYLLPPSDQPLADQLKVLGVSVQRLEAPASLAVERYRALAGAVGYDPEPARIDVPAGMFFVSMSQPLANLAAAALEPDAPGALLASTIASERSAPRVLRVTEPATLKAIDW